MTAPEELYRRLREHYGPQGWWPLYRRRSTPGFDDRGYRTGATVVAPESADDRFEILLGTILTQNTNWRNAERALHRLQEAGIHTADRLLGLTVGELEELIRPSGYYRQKASRLRRALPLLLAREADEGKAAPDREFLLSINGIGPETADSILLYIYGMPFFIADLYTRRLTARLAGESRPQGYEAVRSFFEERLPSDADLFAEFHALIIAHGKEHCAATPVCAGCPCLDDCRYGELRHG